MPATATSFLTAPGQPAFTTETQCGDYVPSYPLGAGEPTALLLTAPFMQVRANYARPAANSNITYGAQTAYFIDDLAFADLRGGVTQWSREYATIPNSWSEYEEYAYTFPGYDGTPGYSDNANITAITAVSDYYVFTCTGNTIVAGESVLYQLSYTRGGTTYLSTGNSIAIATTNSGQITLRIGLPGSGTFTSVSGTIAKSYPISGASAPRTRLTSSRIFHEYALTDSSNIATALPLIAPFQIIAADGSTTDTFTSGTLSIPTYGQYLGYVSSGQEIVAECTLRRYLGNIYVRRTRYVPAQ